MQPREFGSRSWTRTNDPLINSQLLYQLSYPGPTRHDSGGQVEIPPRLRGFGPPASNFCEAMLS